MITATLADNRAAARESNLGAGLIVHPTDIQFSNTRPDQVEVRVTVHNTASERSPPTFARIDAAPLGAFVAWRPLAIARIPRLAPNESHVVRFEAQESRQRPLGSPDRVPPSRVLTALGQADDDQPPRPMSVGTNSGTVTFGRLPADLFKLLGQGGVHFAGNLNIFIGGRAVERHMSKSLRVDPGKTNLAMFIVGSRPDAYAFDLQGPAAAWDAVLFNMTRSHSILPGGGESSIPLRRWVEQTGHSLMILAIRPPANWEEGAVEVHVKQRSTGESAVVEFTLDPAADGPGCYVV
jgi:hypothetical protein